MWQAIKKVFAGYKEVKFLLGLLPALLAFFNNYLYTFIPLTPLLRLWASVFTILFCFLAVGLTASKIRDKAGATNFRNWLRTTVIVMTVLSVSTFGLYIYLLSVFERYSYSQGLSTFFDLAQVVLFALPFVCLSIGLTAFVALFRI